MRRVAAVLILATLPISALASEVEPQHGPELSLQRCAFTDSGSSPLSGWQGTLVNHGWVLDGTLFRESARYSPSKGLLLMTGGRRVFATGTRARPFVQLVGGVIAAGSDDGGVAWFVLSPGAGVDVRVSRHIAVRGEASPLWLVGLPYVLPRVSAGIVVGGGGAMAASRR